MRILPFEALVTGSLALQQARGGLSGRSPATCSSSSSSVAHRRPAATKGRCKITADDTRQLPSTNVEVAQDVIGASRSRRAELFARDERVDAVSMTCSAVSRVDDTPKRPADSHDSVAVVTTAALPWLTGTAVNPLLRAAHLSKAGKRVTLVVPFLALDDQASVFPHGVRFSTPNEQRDYVLNELTHRVDFPVDRVDIKFYRGRYAAHIGSIIPTEDITALLDPQDTDLVLLEEPEHLAWNHTGTPWKQQFSNVVGIAHTNYLDYARVAMGPVVAPAAVAAINASVCRRNCHQIIKLSDAVQRLPNQRTCNVNGVSKAFLQSTAPGKPAVHFDKDIYFIGKAVWAKGFAEMFDLASAHTAKFGDASLGRHPIDIYGDGPDREAIEKRGRRKGIDAVFRGRKDHLDPELARYKIFWNPSTSEVLTTTTAEALAQGKFVLLPKHRCNAFFESFSNCLTYSSREQFHERLSYALSHEPQRLCAEQWRQLTWDGATERLLDSIEEQPDGTPAMVELLARANRAVHRALLALVGSFGLFN